LVKRENQSYDPAQLEQGVVLNGAVIVKDPRQIRQTMADIEAAGRKAGLTLKAIDWQKASGLVGQFVTMIRAVLYISVLIIFAVALVIINNALVMATLERMAEIGTLRAVGAQRRFLLGMLLVEALAVGGLFGGIGSAWARASWPSCAWSEFRPSTTSSTSSSRGRDFTPGLSVTNVAIALTIVLVVSAHPASTQAFSPCGSARARRCNPTSDNHGNFFLDFRIALRSLFQHRRRTIFLVSAIAQRHGTSGPAQCSFDGHQRNHDSRRHDAFQRARQRGRLFQGDVQPVRPGRHRIRKGRQSRRAECPRDGSHWVHRGRGWAKVISDSGSTQVGVTGIDITNEPDFKRVVSVVSGNIDDLASPTRC
jgi:hypothetical protein